MSWENFSRDTEHFVNDMKPEWKRWLKKPWSGHAWVNMFPEMCGWPLNDLDQLRKQKIFIDNAPGYYFGHWLAILFPLHWITIGVLIYLLIK